jgi:hypothetical protein
VTEQAGSQAEAAEWSPPPRFKNINDFIVSVCPDAKRADKDKSVPRQVDIPAGGIVIGGEYAQCVDRRSIVSIGWNEKDLKEAVRSGAVLMPKGAKMPSFDVPSGSKPAAPTLGSDDDPRLCDGRDRAAWIRYLGSSTPERIAREHDINSLRRVVKFLGVEVSERDRIGIATELFQWQAGEQQRPGR